MKFSWKKEKPEDFIVKEISEIDLSEDGNFFIYLLAKRGLSTKELARRYFFSYAGLKDSFALTFQKVCFDRWLGKEVKEDFGKERWCIFKFLGKSKRKLKVGQLKGNKFAVNVKNFSFKLKEAFINYYDVQRLSNNYKKGKKVFLKERFKKKLSWTENFLVDSYLSYLWNKSLELFLREKFKGYYIEEKNEKFFVPLNLKFEELPKFWTILGYKKKLLVSEPYYEEVLKLEGFSLKEFLGKLKALRIKGDYRMTYVLVREPKVSGNYLFFSLPKGSYGTMYLKQIQEV